MVQDGAIVTMADNRKSYMVYRTAPFLISRSWSYYRCPRRTGIVYAADARFRLQ